MSRAPSGVFSIEDVVRFRGTPAWVEETIRNTTQVDDHRARIRFVPAHPGTLERINAYLDQAGHREDLDGPLFRPVRKQADGEPVKPLAPTTVYHRIVKKYAKRIGLGVVGFCVHSLRATAATNALEHAADIAKVQEWLGHSNIATTRLYDRRRTRPEDSPTFRVAY
jgi:integrase